MTRPLVLGMQSSGLYFVSKDDLRQKNEEIKFARTSKVRTNELEAVKLWHLRFDHLPFDRLKLINDLRY